MQKLPVLVSVLALLVAGCSKKNESAPATETPAATPAPAPETSTQAPTAEQIKQAAAAGQESTTAEESPGDASLERMAAMPESAQLPAGKWKAGVNYKPVVPAQPTAANPGQVEVLEVLWLGCPHCYELEPYIEDRLRRYRWRTLAIETGHAIRAASLPPIHADPFDRVLIAQAQLEDMPMVTTDAAITRYDVETIW